MTSNHATAYLCRLSSLHQWHHRYYHEVLHIPGSTNEMVDTLS